jgi:hypothetical protein
MCMAMQARVMGLACGRRELLVSAAFTALLIYKSSAPREEGERQRPAGSWM